MVIAFDDVQDDFVAHNLAHERSEALPSFDARVDRGFHVKEEASGVRSPTPDDCIDAVVEANDAFDISHIIRVQRCGRNRYCSGLSLGHAATLTPTALLVE